MMRKITIEDRGEVAVREWAEGDQTWHDLVDKYLHCLIALGYVLPGRVEKMIQAMQEVEDDRAPCGYGPGDCCAAGTGCYGCGDNPENGDDDDDDSDDICPQCEGSGIGQYPIKSCPFCNGTGVTGGHEKPGCPDRSDFKDEE